MALQLFSLFFSDRLRTIGTIALLAMILVSIVVTWAYPRASEVDSRTVQTLQNVSTQIQRTADTLEKQSLSNTKLNETLSKQLKEMEASRSEGYNLLLNRYGLDVNQASQQILQQTNPELALPKAQLAVPSALGYDDPTPLTPNPTPRVQFPQPVSGGSQR